MGILGWLFKRKDVKTHAMPQALGQRSQALSLEGTRFPLFTEETAFFEECQNSGQAALVLPFADFWEVLSRGIARAKAINADYRLLCSSCLVDMPGSFQMSLPGGPTGGSISGGASKSVKCRSCHSKTGILLRDHPDYGDITDVDMEALRNLWQFRCQLWWRQIDRSEGLCDLCSVNSFPRGEGYHIGSDVICEECAVRITGSERLSELRENPDYYGTSELRRARNFRAGSWRFERGSI